MTETGEGGFVPREAIGSAVSETKKDDVYSGVAADWERFVGERGKEDRARFLTEVLKEKGCREVFDAGLGVGFDNISLNQAGFTVTSNEIDNEFLDHARQNAAKAGVELKTTQYDWRDLREMSSGSVDAVTLLGNSLTQLLGRENQLQALEEFRRVLRYGGVLVIDERNYQDILDRREEILADTLTNFRLRHKEEPGRATYGEDGGVKGVPISINDEEAVFSYFDEQKKIWLPTKLVVHPFKRGELAGMLREVGFSDVSQYSDMQPEFDETADFYEYVAVKS